MSKIIKISGLWDNYHEMQFGSVGVDIETKEIKYYSYYNSKQEYNSNLLYEFDPNNLDNDSYVSWHMAHCRYKRPSLSEELPEELKSLTKSFINCHKEYNINNNYPTKNIDENQINLSIQYVRGFSLFGDSKPQPMYTPVANIIELPFSKTDWNREKDNERGRFANVLVHEIGHMKVSNYTLDEANNILHVRTGFYWSELGVEPIKLENGDIFYEITKKTFSGENCNERALEEIMNDYDCSLAFSSFNGNYPKLGKRLNDLCDQKLTYARYDVGIEQFYTSLQKIINSEALANELLKYIGASIYGDNPEISENRAVQLIRKYEAKKFG